MVCYDYSLCGIPIRVESAQPLPLNGDLDAFVRAGGGTPAVCYAVDWYDGEWAREGEQIFSTVGYSIHQTATGYVYFYNVGSTINPDCIVLEVFPAADVWQLHLPQAHRALLTRSGLALAPLVGRDLLFAANRRLMVHSSLIRWQGKGLMFTGPSGMGKSTQSALWERYAGAEVLNGDKSIVHAGEEIVAWGSPWAGTSGIVRNESAPLRGIVALRQAKDNCIERLSGREALAELMPRMGTLPWGGEWHVKAMDCAIALVERVPVYRLHCRPDADAVKLTRDTVFGA